MTTEDPRYEVQFQFSIQWFTRDGWSTDDLDEAEGLANELWDGGSGYSNLRIFDNHNREVVS